MTKYEGPSTSMTAFSCPHCGAYTTQTWYELRALEIGGEDKLPHFTAIDQDWDEVARNLQREHSIGQNEAKKVTAAW